MSPSSEQQQLCTGEGKEALECLKRFLIARLPYCTQENLILSYDDWDGTQPDYGKHWNEWMLT